MRRMIMNSSILILVFVQIWLFTTLGFGECRESVCIPSERETLIKFKHHLIDRSNRLLSWNNSTSNSNCCHWPGVLCHNLTSHVLHLHLNTSFYAFIDGYNGWDTEAYERWSFGGEISPCLADLKHLNYLDFSGNELLGEGMAIPSFLGTMTSLTHLDLSHTRFMGNIPSQIGNLSKLRYLDLSENYFLGESMAIPSFLGTMTSLTHLDLRYTGFMGNIPSQIGNLSNLVYLDLGSYFLPLFVESVDWLSSMSKLEYLHLNSANLSKSFHWLHTLQSLPSLTDLYLVDCTLPPYNEPSFVNFSSLLTLHLFYNRYSPAISFVPKWIFKLKKLVSLQLSNNEIQGPIPGGLRNLTLLQNLDLSINSFSSSIPDWLYGLHRLKFLNLGSNNLHGTISDALGNLTSLVSLDLSYNQLEGTIPTSLANLCNLREIHFSDNIIGGALPRSFGKLSTLRYLDLSTNKFNGNPFESLGSLSKLSSLQIDGNNFQRVVKEDDLANLTSLKMFHASGNNFTLKVDPNWLPKFQLASLDISSWQLGQKFPSWIQSQNELLFIELSNTGILDSIPTRMWEALSHVSYLSLSGNHIHGELGTTLKNPISIQIVDLSSNHLSGKLPYLSNAVYGLDLSSNSFSESMQDFLCNNLDKPMQLEFLNLASNNLSGEIPNCWMIWPFLANVDLQNNHFVGNLPSSMGSLAVMQSLEIRNNLLSGIFPTSLKTNNQLISLDLGENNFSGCIPTWVGEKLLNMKILRLRSNRFSSHIPNEICQMSDLQVLDLAQNNLSGNLPSCFSNLSAMTLMNQSTNTRIYSRAPNSTNFSSGFGIVSVQLWLKGRGDEYKSILGLVTSIDLSSNKLLGEIPREIIDLNGLNFLNLSHNQLIGHIPQGIGNMVLLQSIDFSRNQLSGEIPPTISNLSFLSKLDLSYNHLKGKIPTATQLQTFDASSFIGNKLCGPPLPINCSSNGKTHSYEGSDGHGVNWFFVSTTIGYVVGFWIVIAPLLICRSWRYTYFHFLDHVWFKLQSFCSCSITV